MTRLEIARVLFDGAVEMIACVSVGSVVVLDRFYFSTGLSVSRRNFAVPAANGPF